jgi:hypothetical protein
MQSPYFRRVLLGMGWFILVAWAQVHAAGREDCEREYRPQSGQAGKDVIWVPTGDALVQRMLQMADTKASDLVFDLGAGDGKIAITAAQKFGARAVGVEYNPEFARYAQCLAEAAGVSDRVKIMQGDIFQTDFSQATVVTLYLLPELNLRLRPTLLKMQPGTRVVSHSFLMGEWGPDERSNTDDGSAYLWIVPAQVEGRWTFSRRGSTQASFTLDLKQKFQSVEGTAATRGAQSTLQGKLVGATLTATFEQDDRPVELSGRVQGDRMTVSLTRGSTREEHVGRRVE